MGTGARPSLAVLQVVDPDSAGFQSDDKPPLMNWGTLSPGETKEITIPYYVYKNSFASEQDFEKIDLAKFCLEVNDFDPGIRYRFWLG